MKNLILFLLILGLSITPFARAEGITTLSPQNIRLKDGTVIKGRLVGVNGDRYVIDSANLGHVEIKISELESVTTQETAPLSGPNTNTIATTAVPSPSPGAATMPPQMQQMGQQMLSDPEIIAAMKDLLQDPSVLPLLQDPGVLQAAMSMDPQQAQNNPAVQKLLQHPKMQQLMDLVAKKLLGHQSSEKPLNPQTP